MAARKGALKYAAEEFFATRDPEDLAATTGFVNQYFKAAEFRNQVAHGMAMQPADGTGYFLCPPSYSSRRRETPLPTQRWGLGARYFLRVAEIDVLERRFQDLLECGMSLVLYLNEKYDVLPPGTLHP